MNRRWKWASRDFRRIEIIIIRRKRVERVNERFERLARGPRFAARLFFPRIVEKTLGPPYQETYIRGIYKIPDVVIVNEYVRTRLYPIVRS